MLSFQIINSGRTINVDCDAKGMAILLKALAQLVGDRASHVHLWTAAASGGQLSDKTPWGEDAVPEVIINYQEGDAAGSGGEVSEKTPWQEGTLPGNITHDLKKGD
jgi:hypothetical protein